MGEYLAKYKIHGYRFDHARGIDDEYSQEKEVRLQANTDEEAVQLSKEKIGKMWEENNKKRLRGNPCVGSINLESLFEIREIDLKVPLTT